MPPHNLLPTPTLVTDEEVGEVEKALTLINTVLVTNLKQSII